MNKIDDLVIEAVLESEPKCRAMVAHMLSRGVTVTNRVGLVVSLDNLTHEDCQAIVRAVLGELEARENLQ